MKIFARLFPLFLAIIFIAMSCSQPKPLQYRSISNVVVKKLSLSQPSVALDVELFNPNTYGLDVKEAALDVYINNQFAGTGTLNQLMHINGNQAVKMPVTFQADLGKMLSNAVQILLNNEVDLRVEGYVKAGKGVFIKVPIKYSGKQRLQGL